MSSSKSLKECGNKQFSYPCTAEKLFQVFLLLFCFGSTITTFLAALPNEMVKILALSYQTHMILTISHDQVKNIHEHKSNI